MARDATAKGAALGGDIVIVGGGLAALFTALELAPRPVTVISAAPLGEGAASAWAQGGMAAAVGAGDSPRAHAADTVRAGAGTVDAAVAEGVAAEAAERVRDLVALGVPFDRDPSGRFLLSREAAHSAQRVLRVTGDRAGQAIMQALIAAVRRTPCITVLEGYGATGLLVAGGRVHGVRLELAGAANAAWEVNGARAVVLATGGIGGLYAVTTNPPHARGEGLAIALRAGATAADCEFVQFHPTAIAVGLDPAPLATEALRGEGALLINRRGERFMVGRHPDAELAPRDIVARAVFEEIAGGRGAFLDCRQAIGARMPQAFPTVYESCRAAGLDPVREPIPVAPAAHYHMGGIATDARGRTSLPGLWAVGEVASTGLHGANRLASNSLLEAVVFAARAAADAASPDRGSLPSRPMLARSGRRPPADPALRAAALRTIRETMSRDVGVVRDRAGLDRAMAVLDGIARSAGADAVVANWTLAARAIAASARRREESRGAHFRSDYPEARPGWRHRSSVTLADVEGGAARVLGHGEPRRGRGTR